MENVKKSEQWPIFVLGGTGKTGRRVVQRLKERQWPIRIGSRIEHPPFDWLDQTTWQPALDGIKAVYITFQPDLAVPGSVDTIRSFAQMAVGRGVERLVLLSGRNESEAQACEQVIRSAGVGWTILRASWFNQNFSESYLLEPLREGVLALPAGPIGEPFVDADDIADVAVASLTDERHVGQVYELTGPRLLTFRDALAEIAQATGRPLQYASVSVEAYTAALQKASVPEDYIRLLTYLFTEVLDGRNAHLTNDLERALGRKPVDFSDYVQKTALTGVWKEMLTNSHG